MKREFFISELQQFTNANLKLSVVKLVWDYCNSFGKHTIHLREAKELTDESYPNVEKIVKDTDNYLQKFGIENK